MKLPPLPTGENMLFHPVLACPRCKLPLGIAITKVYDYTGDHDIREEEIAISGGILEEVYTEYPKLWEWMAIAA